MRIDSFLHSEKLLEEAKALCKSQILAVAKEINDKMNFITLRTEQLENEEEKVNHLLKLLQNKLMTSGLPKLNKVLKELEITKQELEEAIRENYDLHETLEEINIKSLENQEVLEEENNRLKDIINSMSTKIEY